MLISKFDLYKTEWLDLVFENRNKEYGAYELRQHNGRTTLIAMGITFFTIGVLAAGSIILSKAPVHTLVGIPVDLHPVAPPVIIPPKKIVPPEIKPLHSSPPATPPATTKFVEMKVVVDQVAVDPPKNIDLVNTAIGPVTTKGPAGPVNTLPVETPGPGIPTVDNSVHDVGGVDVMPEPMGGTNAWAKFLNKNLRFPVAAQEDGVSGRAIMSFVIEKDGSLSNITVERAGGHGFDEEAMRVLKLAKAWKPGLQNGQPVRVKYMIPINFQLSSDN